MEKIKIENIFYFYFSYRLYSNTFFLPKMQIARSVASEVTVYFNFGFSGVNLDSSSISQYALTDLLSHLRRSVTGALSIKKFTLIPLQFQI